MTATATLATSLARVSVADWERLETVDGYRFEIIQGELTVTPSPSVQHTEIQSALLVALHPQLPEGLVSLIGAEWQMRQRGVVAAAPQPDLLVVPKGGKRIVDAPLLVVEVLSPSDAKRLDNDLTRIEGKRLDYATHGLQDYLEVDAAAGTITRFELEGGALVPVQTRQLAEAFEAERPFPFRLEPGALL